MDLFDLNFERKWALNGPFPKKKHFKRHVQCFIGVLVGPHVARGSDVTQACDSMYYL